MAHGGATWQAIAGIELALWDIKGKALGVPVYELVGGPTRSHQKVYWSHMLSYQVGSYERL
jgi:L-alanine-DL-glutamate epimerase-like enolase superfamily enzyme